MSNKSRRKGQKQEKQQRPELTAEQKLERKLELAAKPDQAVVSRKALETSALVAIVGKNDFLIDQLRKRLGFDPTINVAKAISLINLNGLIRDLMNLENAAICESLGRAYEAPRGMDAPRLKKDVDLEKLVEDIKGLIVAAIEPPAEKPAKKEKAPAVVAEAAPAATGEESLEKAA